MSLYARCWVQYDLWNQRFAQKPSFFSFGRLTVVQSGLNNGHAEKRAEKAWSDLWWSRKGRQKCGDPMKIFVSCGFLLNETRLSSSDSVSVHTPLKCRNTVSCVRSHMMPWPKTITACVKQFFPQALPPLASPRRRSHSISCDVLKSARQVCVYLRLINMHRRAANLDCFSKRFIV